jgi:hypothetical protein
MNFKNVTEFTPASPFLVSAKGNILEALGAKYKPTKRGQNYLPYYWMHLRDIHNTAKKVVEIGLQTDTSIRMWEEFFPNATIYGVDIDAKCKRFEGERRRVLIGDQGDPAFCQRLIEETGGGIDVIIDDGSHKVHHQIATFEMLFPALASHGIYAIEDVGGCVGDVNLVTVNAAKTLVDNVMYWPPDLSPREWSHLAKFDDRSTWADRNIIGVAFYRWIIFVMRGFNPEDNPYLVAR